MAEVQSPKVTLLPSPLQPAVAEEEQPMPRPSVCEECGVQPFKYRCPGCSLRTCSLPCVKSHKQRTNCNGKRDRTHFIHISEFNDAHLLSDYNMLEETKRVAESARKLRQELIGNAGFKWSPKMKEIRRVARTRKIDVFFLPAGMTMRKKNRSYYNRWKKVICWTVEWSFYSTDIVLVDHGVDEHKGLRSLVENHLNIDGSWNTQKQYKLRPFRKESVDNLKFFIKEKVKGTESPFRELDINCSLSKQLAGITLLEFPIIHVVLPLHFDRFGISNYSKGESNNVPAESSSGLPSSTGVTSNEKVFDCGFSNDEDPVKTEMLQNMSNYDSEGRYRGDLSISNGAYVGDQDLEEGEIPNS